MPNKTASTPNKTPRTPNKTPSTPNKICIPKYEFTVFCCVHLHFLLVYFFQAETNRWHTKNDKYEVMEKKRLDFETVEENPFYPCAQCNLSFKMNKDLKTHMLQHDGKKTHVPQLQPVWLHKQQSFSSETTHAGSQWREAFCLQTVQLLLHPSFSPQDAHASA